LHWQHSAAYSRKTDASDARRANIVSRKVSSPRRSAVVAHEHIVQLFDAPRSLADAVSQFLIEGRALGNQQLVIARASHWKLIEGYLERRGFLVDDHAQPLTIIDARKLRARVTRRGMLDPKRLHDTLGEIVGQLASAPGGLRVYGELVELFAEEGSFEQAAAIEDYWNHLAERFRFTLLCGYSAAHFADPGHACHLRDICARHTSVRSHSADSLGTWLTTR
jgi:hypothetical protein